MKFFVAIRRSFESVGVCQHQTADIYLKKLKSFIILAISVLNIIFDSIFLLFHSKTFGEYSECFYNAASVTTTFFLILEFIRNNTKINQLIRNFEDTIRKRKDFQQFWTQLRFIDYYKIHLKAFHLTLKSFHGV